MELELDQVVAAEELVLSRRGATRTVSSGGTAAAVVRSTAPGQHRKRKACDGCTVETL
jgi:hypothetical protein